MDIEVKENAIDLTSDPDAIATCEVATAGYFVGAETWLTDSNGLQEHVVVAKIIDSTHLQLRKYDSPTALGFDATTIVTAKSELDCSALAAGHYNATIQAATAGRDGNLITVRLVGDAAGAVTIVRTVNAFVIHYKTGVSTVGNVNTAIGALAGGDALIVVSAAGTAATVLTAPADNFAATALTGGSTPRLCQPQQIVKVNKKFKKISLL